MTRIFTLVVLSLATLVSLSGCTSYVNIPAQVGDVALHDPNMERALNVQLQALRTVRGDLATASGAALGKPIHVVLPAGTSEKSYALLAAQLEGDAPGSGPGITSGPATTRPGEIVLESRQVRVRGWYAQVDVVRPWDPAKPDGPKQVVTVTLKNDPIAGWHVTRTKAWKISVDDALIESVRQAEIDIRE